MLIALLSDIHANREALAACLAHAEQSKAERYIFLGDYVGYGADPGWVVDCVAAHVARGATALLGNHDAAVLSPSERMNAIAEEAVAWTRTQLDAEQSAFLRDLPARVEEHDRLFVHANPWAPTGWDYVSGRETAARAFQTTSCRQIFCGHVHKPALYNMTATAKIIILWADFVRKLGTLMADSLAVRLQGGLPYMRRRLAVARIQRTARVDGNDPRSFLLGR